jgi:hypothetical protein
MMFRLGERSAHKDSYQGGTHHDVLSPVLFRREMDGMRQGCRIIPRISGDLNGIEGKGGGSNKMMSFYSE